MKQIIIIFFSLILGIPSISGQDESTFSEKDNRFRFGSINKVDERDSYTVYYPVGTNEYLGVVVLIHSDQASNPSAYGDLIEQLLKSNYIVIYPSYQSYLWSNNKSDVDHITSSLKKAYDDIKKNYPDIMQLPVAFLGHSMGGIIAFELAIGTTVPKKPSCIISIAPGEVSRHKIDQINFNKLDNYDVYLVIEEANDKFYKRQTGSRIFANLDKANRRKYIVHEPSTEQKSKHLNLWAYDQRFSSKNNGGASYFSKLIGKTDAVDRDFYWIEIKAALDCAFSREGCDNFRDSSDKMRTGL